MFRELIAHSLSLLALCALYEFVSRLLPVRSSVARLGLGLAFGIICVAGMANPIALAPGVLLDARIPVLTMAGLFGGALPAAIAAGMAAAYRYGIGGAGMAAGFAVIATAASMGVLYRRAHEAGRLTLGAGPLLVLSVLVNLAGAVWGILLPAHAMSALVSAQGTFSLVALGYMLVLIPSTLLLALLLREISEQRRIKQALERSESMWRAVSLASPDVLLVVDEDGRYLQAVSPDEGLLAARMDEFVGKTFADVLPPDEARRFLDFVRRTVAAGTPQTIEYPMDTLDGTHVFEGRAQRIDTPLDGRRAVVFVARDVTRRVAAEQELRIAAIAFEGQQGLVIVGADQRVLRVNAAYSRLMGYTASEVIGQPASVLSGDGFEGVPHDEWWAAATRDWHWEGEVWARRKDGGSMPLWYTITAVRSPDGSVTHYVVTMNDITDRKSEDDRIRGLAFHDHLTLLPNRGLLLDRVERALATARRTGGSGALMFLDLDDFKAVNDLYGHHVGDLLLRQVAGRLTALVREVDTVARLGGDEFVVLLENLDPQTGRAEADAERIAGKIVARLGEPFDFGGRVVRIGASIGVTMFGPADAELAPEVLLDRADAAMYRGKRAGKNRVRFRPPTASDAHALRSSLPDRAATGD